MSIRAYRVITQELEKEPSFNLWHNQKLTDDIIYLRDTIAHLDDGAGTLEVDREALQEYINSADFSGDTDERQALQKDIDNTRDGYITYECY